jgi:hypothetical protein
MKQIMLILLVCLFLCCFTVSGNEGVVEKILSSQYSVCGCLNNKDDSMMVSYYSDDGQQTGIYYYKNNKKWNEIKGVSYGTISPNGKLFTYIKRDTLMLFDKKGKLFKKININSNNIDTITWSLDSKYLYISLFEDKTNLYRIDIAKGKNEKICSFDDCMKPVPLKNNNEFVWMQSKDPKAAASDCNLVKYNYISKKFNQVKIPLIKDLYIYEDFTISPNGKILMFQSKKTIYVIDLVKQKIISKFTLPGFAFPELPDIGEYSWKSDSSYVVFSCLLSQHYGIYKYTVPQKY